MQNIGQSKWWSNSPMLRFGQLTNGYQFWRKVEDRRKKFQYCLNPNYPQKFLYLRAIQRHSRRTINPALQDNNVLLAESFTEYIYHVGNGKELRSTVNHGLTPGAVSLKTGRQAVFFTVVHPMVNQDGLRRNPMRLVTSKNRAIQKYLETLAEYGILVQFEARSTKRTAIFSNKIKRSYSPRHTACRVHWESDMHEDQGSALSEGKRHSKTACSQS